MTTCLFAGGTGKTTTAVTVASALAHFGRRVLLIDCDTQNNCATYMDHRGTDAEIGLPPDERIRNMPNFEGGLFRLVAQKEFAPIEIRPNLSLLTGGTDSISQLKNFIGQQTRGVEKVLQRAIQPFVASYDYIIMDSPPSYDRLTENIFFAVNEVICPVICEPKGLDGVLIFAEKLVEVQAETDIRVEYVVPTRYDARANQSAEIYQELARTFPKAIVDPIRIDVRLSDSVSFGETIWEFDPQNQRSAKDYGKFIQRIMADE